MSIVDRWSLLRSNLYQRDLKMMATGGRSLFGVFWIEYKQNLKYKTGKKIGEFPLEVILVKNYFANFGKIE